MKSSGYVVGILGAAGLVGEGVRNVLRERAFPVSEWRLFERETGGANDVADDQPEVWAELCEEAVRGTDFLFSCATEEASACWVPVAVESGTTAIDVTQRFACEERIPMVVPEVNPGAARAVRGGALIVSPMPGVIALSVALKPIQDRVGLRRVVVTAFEPVSWAGRAGIDELARQTQDILCGRSPSVDEFAHRIAFNLLPKVGKLGEGGRTCAEEQLERDLPRVLSAPGLRVAATGVYVPTFFGNAYAVNVEPDSPLDCATARALLIEAPGIVLDDDVTAYPTAASAVGSEATHVGRLRADPTVPGGISLWVTLDGTRKGAAVNAVQIAELVVAGRS